MERRPSVELTESNEAARWEQLQELPAIEPLQESHTALLVEEEPAASATPKLEAPARRIQESVWHHIAERGDDEAIISRDELARLANTDQEIAALISQACVESHWPSRAFQADFDQRRISLLLARIQQLEGGEHGSSNGR